MDEALCAAVFQGYIFMIVHIDPWPLMTDDDYSNDDNYSNLTMIKVSKK